MGLRSWLHLIIISLREALHLLTGVGPCCRFSPTCSRYAVQAIERHGIVKGIGFTVKRLICCHPFGAYGWDPVPPTEARGGCNVGPNQEVSYGV